MAKLEKGNLLPSGRSKRAKSTIISDKSKKRNLNAKSKTTPKRVQKLGLKRTRAASKQDNATDSLSETNKLTKKQKFQRESERGNKRHYEELRLKAKAANERMRQLEKQGIKSPAYQAVQARLEILGRTEKGDRGRRFSETGNATYNEMEITLKIINEFLNAKTSKLKGAKEYQSNVWESANKNNKLSAAGITRDQWINFWESMPDRKNRLYGSSQIVAMVRAYSIKNGELEDENKLSVQEIADQIQASENLKDVYAKLGLSTDEVIKARIKRNKTTAKG